MLDGFPALLHLFCFHLLVWYDDIWDVNGSWIWQLLVLNKKKKQRHRQSQEIPIRTMHLKTNACSPLAQSKLHKKQQGNHGKHRNRPWSNTTSDHINGSFAASHAPPGSFYGEYHVTVRVAIKAERGKERHNSLPNGPEKWRFHQADRPLAGFLKRCHLL